MAYRLVLAAWRFLCLCYYAEARLDVLKLTKHVEDGSVRARWRIRGLPMHSVMLRFFRKDKSHLYRYQRHVVSLLPIAVFTQHTHLLPEYF